MSKKMKLQKNKYKLGIITSSLAFALTTSLAIGLPDPDNYYFEGSEVENVQIDDDMYKVTFSNGDTGIISRGSLDNNKNIAYTGWTNVTLSNGRETPISARPNIPNLTIKMFSSIAAIISVCGIYKNSQKYVESKRKIKQ